MGLPGNVIELWHSNRKFLKTIPFPVNKTKPLKNGEVPLLESYSGNPGTQFWGKIPFNPLPSADNLHTPLDADKFEELYLKVKDSLSFTQRQSVLESVNNIRNGADSLVDFSALKPLNVKNSKNMSRSDVGAYYTDQLVSMLKKKFVSGPFVEPPIKNLRVNKLFTVEQSDKFRPILHLSYPKKNCFNNAIIENKMTKVVMSSPAIVAEKISKIGRNAIMSKIDHSSGIHNSEKY